KKQGDLLQRFNDYYSSIYELFNEKKYDEVIHSTQSVIQGNQYDALGNTAQLAYLQALAIGRICEIEYFEESLSKIIEQYPSDELVVPLVKQHIAYIEAHPDQFAGRATALEDINQERKRFIDEPIITPWPELSYNRQYNIPQSIPQNRKNYSQV